MDRQQLIIFTDLDGTLLDHHNYSWAPAQPALSKLKELDIPVIICTSKTAAEVKELHQNLQLTTPFIVENGAGIIFPEKPPEHKESAHFFGKPYTELTQFVQQLRRQKNYQFTGFSDFSVAEVVKETGLEPNSAALAKQRLFSEPIRWDDTPEALEQFRRDLANHRLQLLRGGRFYHILDQKADKGTALHWLTKYYRQQNPSQKWFSVALGDGPNDQAMMEASDLAVIIPSQSGVAPKPRCGKILHAKAPGPCGWNQAIHDILLLYTDKGIDHG